MITTTRFLPAQIYRPRSLLVGTVFGCAAAFMFFLSVVAVYVRERARARHEAMEWFAEGTVELGPSGFVFWTLVLSVFTVQWAVQAINAEDRVNAYVALALTTLFGVAIFNQLWFIINDTGFALAASNAEFLFFVINGTFIVFLIAAVLFITFTFVRALAGQFGPKRAEAVSAAALFWHTVVLMWAVVYFLVYINK
ncbi:MAG: cytochrome c oxidase subunit 3 [Acidimicrobiia bacterium]|nr:cytochrome c oxidase subunit 3 [Acidimicrobiia bacterium]MCY4458505.1 cytochrome c oxidase subunit 3 [Acidimicrobiaceae bacterium]